MIVPFSWMWEQLNGPIVSAIKDALYGYMYTQFNDKMDSLNDLSIESADTALLTVFGMLMGMPRPVVVRQSENNRIMFASDYYNPSEYGFSKNSGQWSPSNVGGSFAEAWETGEDAGEYAPTNWYRAILLAYANSDGRMGSLSLLDDIVSAIRSVDNPAAALDHRFEFFTDSNSVHMTGDFELFLSSVNTWSDIDIASSLLESLMYGGYAPVPRGNVYMNPDATTSTLLDDALQAYPTLDKYVPPTGWEPAVNIGDTVTVGTVIGTVVGTLEDGSNVDVGVKSEEDGVVAFLPPNINNWVQPITIVG